VGGGGREAREGRKKQLKDQQVRGRSGSDIMEERVMPRLLLRILPDWVGANRSYTDEKREPPELGRNLTKWNNRINRGSQIGAVKAGTREGGNKIGKKS